LHEQSRWDVGFFRVPVAPRGVLSSEPQQCRVGRAACLDELAASAAARTQQQGAAEATSI